MADRFWDKVDRGAPDECWPWLGAAFVEGYGQYWLDGRIARAHRVAFERVDGPIPEGALVLHRCDNPPCCNPAHLFLGDHRDNVRDMFGKGRGRNQNTGRATCHLGHELAGANLYVTPTGRRQCRACQRERERRYRLKGD